MHADSVSKGILAYFSGSPVGTDRLTQLLLQRVVGHADDGRTVATFKTTPLNVVYIYVAFEFFLYEPVPRRPRH